ncbi:MAG TPA: amidohydrolase [Clostridia bacterium]|nr:amidohydrolase [Clostridia bacterium]
MLLLKNIEWVIQDATAMKKNCDILIDGNRIAEIGGSLTVEKSHEVEVIDCSGLIAVPGFVNSHTHLYQCLLRGIRDDLPLEPWCQEVTLPFYSKVRKLERVGDISRIAYIWSALASIEAIRSGTTCIFDNDYISNGVMEAWADSGMRGVMAIGFADQGLSPELTEETGYTKATILKTIKKWHNPNSRITCAIMPPTPYLCSKDALTWMKNVAEDYGLVIQTHLSETRSEAKTMLEAFGEPGAMYLDRLGLLGPRFSAVHCVHLLPGEAELLAERGVSMVYNPKSNMKLGSGVAPIRKFVDLGINIALATDGPASNDLLDMFEEMRAAALIQKAVCENPAALTARTAFHMATAGGAKVCGIDSGTLVKGKLADIVLLSQRTSNITPFNDPVETIVYCAKESNVRTVIIDGQIVMRDGVIHTIDEVHALDEAQRLWSEMVAGTEPPFMEARKLPSSE